MSTADTEVLDVRAILDRGEEPFGAIMEAKARLRPGQCLRIIAPFEPLPLYTMFEAAGYRARASRKGETEWWIDFCPAGTPHGDAATKDLPQGTLDLDLRELEPSALPQKSLQALRTLGRGETLVLRTRSRPVQLFEQIEDGAFDYDCEAAASDHWKTHIWRADTF